MEHKKAQELHFDPRNPRLVEYEKNMDEGKILNCLWDDMAVDQIVLSILANGFFENEAMYAVEENGKLIIVEGNRRLAAVKAILNPELIECGGMKKYLPKITDKLKNDLANNLPVIIMPKREDTWRYIGFKHVNGAVKWDSFAKAEYIAHVHNDYGVSLEQIAEQIGDTNKTILKLYQGIMVLRQAEEKTKFKRDDTYNKRLFFSHLYTAIGYDGFQKYLNLDASQEALVPVPEEKIGELEDVMDWIFGSKSRDVKPFIKSQNPDLRNLNSVLLSTEAVAMLKASKSLDAAYDVSLPGDAVLSDAIMKARSHISKALSKLNYYDGNEEMMQSAKTLAEQIDALFDGMKNKYNERRNKEENKSKRSLD